MSENPQHTAQWYTNPDLPLDKRRAGFELGKLQIESGLRKLIEAELKKYEVAAAQENFVNERLVKGGDFIFNGPAEPEAIWGDGNEVLWASGEPLMIVGPPGVGKTTLVNQIVQCRLGFASTLLGHSIKEDIRPVLYLAMDRPTDRPGHATQLHGG